MSMFFRVLNVKFKLRRVTFRRIQIYRMRFWVTLSLPLFSSFLSNFDKIVSEIVYFIIKSIFRVFYVWFKVKRNHFRRIQIHGMRFKVTVALPLFTSYILKLTKFDKSGSEIVYFNIKAIMSIFLESFKSDLKLTGPVFSRRNEIWGNGSVTLI
jgi:hypothetical protein